MSYPASICVFCGSSMGHDSDNRQAAHDLGRMIAEAGSHLIYGGGHVGLMGVIADSALASGGKVTGIIPAHLRYAEDEHPGLTELIEVESMFVRKRLMVERSDAFIALPGGLGTIDEVLDVITLAQLSQHAKPMVLVNLKDYWRPFGTLLDHVIDGGYARDAVRELYTLVPDLEGAMDALKSQD
jgi:uncharacterized protein (TIGR00730 family)